MMDDKAARQYRATLPAARFTPPTASQTLRLQRADARVAEAVAALLEARPELRLASRRFAE